MTVKSIEKYHAVLLIFMLLLMFANVAYCAYTWLWTANDFVFQCGTSFLVFQDDFYANYLEIGTGGSYYKWYNLVLGSGSEISSLKFEGENCNVTLTELNEDALLVADVANASTSTSIGFTLGYDFPYLQAVEGNVTNFSVDLFANNVLTWNVTGDGSNNMTVAVAADFAPSYVRIDGVEIDEFSGWQRIGNTVYVEDVLASTHSYEMGFGAVSATKALYFRSDLWTVSDELGYKLMGSNTFASTSVSVSLGAGDDNVDVGVRVWTYDVFEEATELTGGSPEAVVHLVSNTSGIETFVGNFDCENFFDIIDHLKVVIYAQADGGGYVAKAQFLSGSGDDDIKYYLDMDNATCAVYYYLNFTSEDSLYIHFGDRESNNARMLLNYDKPDPWRIADARLKRQDFYGFLSAPWVWIFGNMFWSILYLFFATTIIIRHGSYKMILLLSWIMGGSGSLLWAIVPASGLVVAALMLGFALAGTLFKIIHK